MNRGKDGINKGSLVLVQPMRYCLSFTEGGIESLNEENPQERLCHHWTEDGFKARVLEVVELHTREHDIEEYVKIKIFGQGRKHFVKRNNEKTKIVWIQSRLVSECKGKDTKKKENKP